MQHYRFDAVRLPGEWRAPGVVSVAEDGTVAGVVGTPAPGVAVEEIGGIAVPGVPNLHSHAFQRALAGHGEVRGPGQDFWTWREAMYELALRLVPEQVEAVAAMVYAELLEGGYTGVGEFHYLFHSPDGTPYDDKLVLLQAVHDAAQSTGIGLTLLPVLYRRGGVGKPLEGRQRRFGHGSLESFLETWRGARSAWQGGGCRVGVAAHSLRAVVPEELQEMVSAVTETAPDAAIHLHIAEQEREVEEIVAAWGQRPIAWLLEELPVDRRWCLVHATHCAEAERRGLVASGAVAGLCPTTEASLGDGLFPAVEFLEEGGTFGVGSDSQVVRAAADELRLLEWGQRLRHQRRNLLAAGSHGHVGTFLYERACTGGAQALGAPGGALEPGLRADLVVLDADHPGLAGHPLDSVLDAFVFTAGQAAIDRVMVGGSWVVLDGRHVDRERIAARYRETVNSLWRAS